MVFASDALAGKIAIVTGAAGGIGLAIVRAFTRAGAAVIATDLHPSSHCADDALWLEHDVVSSESWAAVVRKAQERFGRIDVLVNCAGIFRPVPISAETVDGFLETARVNQIGVFLGMQAVFTAMQAAGGGSIVNLSSGAGLYGNPGTLSYTASKFAVRGMTKVAAIEYASAGIRVNSIHPAAVRTPMIANLTNPDEAGSATLLKRVMEPDEVANMVLFLASDASSYSTGVEFVCDGGLSA